jgi:predicted RNase H-like HicB family nuclease
LIKVSSVTEVRLTIVVEPEENPGAGFMAYCPELPGCFSSGRTAKEARARMAEAVEQHLKALRLLEKPIPPEAGAVLVEEVSFPVPS